MKKIILFVAFVAASFYTNAQVGIGTNLPTTDLDVAARTTLIPNEFNGLTIPRIAVLPTAAAEIAPAGTLIYLTAVSGTNPIGFYYSTGTAYVNVASAASGAFVETAATTVVATDRTANITRTGNVSVGGTLNSGKLNVEVVSANTGADPIGIKIENRNTGVANAPTYGLFSENQATNVGTKFGIRNDVSASGNGPRIGIENNVFNSSGSAVHSVTGIRNVIGATNGASALNYGIYSEIGTPGSDTNNYGVFSIARGTNARNNYSGWFQGDRFAIRNEDASTGYDLTVETGAAGRVLTSNGAGGTSWSNAANAVPVQYSMWQGGDYNINNLTSYTELGGIQTIFDPSLIDSTNNVEIKLVIWVTDYAGQTDFELQAFDVNRNGSIAIPQSQLIYENNAAGGFITTNWIDYNAGTASPGNNNRFVQLFLRGLITGMMNTDAQIRSVYVLIRPNQ